MNTKLNQYDPATSAVFRKTDDEFGGLSNFSLSWPSRLYGNRIRTTEHLYQAMRFPDSPEVQEEVLDAREPKEAKTVARQHDARTRKDWMDVRVDIMSWCLEVKLAQHVTRFGALLDSTGERPIVEFSKRDSFWGADQDSTGNLTGQNVLGQLLDELRTKYRDSQANHQLAEMHLVTLPDGVELSLLDLPIGDLNFSEQADLPVLLTTDEIYSLQLRITASPAQLSEWLRQAQLTGRVTSREETIELLSSLKD